MTNGRPPQADDPDSRLPIAFSQPDFGSGFVAPAKVQKGSPKRFLVCVTARRRRLLDEDNLFPKFLVDCLRYCGALPTDAPELVSIQCRQEKVGLGEEEETIIEVTRI